MRIARVPGDCGPKPPFSCRRRPRVKRKRARARPVRSPVAQRPCSRSEGLLPEKGPGPSIEGPGIMQTENRIYRNSVFTPPQEVWSVAVTGQSFTAPGVVFEYRFTSHWTSGFVKHMPRKAPMQSAQRAAPAYL